MINEGKRAKSKKMIMHAAKGLFEDKGLDHVTFSDIAEQANVCRTTVFNHFANTGELMQAICEEEIAEIKDYCTQTGDTGLSLIKELFDKLIEDTAYYPGLMTELANSSILGSEEEKSITTVEHMILENLPKKDGHEKMILVMGAYYGLVNHYHCNNIKFNAEEMKREFHQMLNRITGGQRDE